MQDRIIQSEKIRNNIAHILQTASGDKLDITYQIYDLILADQGNEPQTLAYFIKCSEEMESSSEEHVEKHFSEEEKYQFTVAYGKMIDGSLEALLRENYTEDEFYARLWNFIENTPILSEKKKKVFALYYIWVDVRVPYFQLKPGLRMSNETFQQYCKSLDPLIREARFILFAPTDQKTERASRLLSLIERLENENEKAVLMVQILNMSDKSRLRVPGRGIVERG